MHFTTMENMMKVLLIAISILSLGALEFKYEVLSDSYNFVRPYVIIDEGSECLKVLKAQGVQFKALGNAGSGQCFIKNAVRVTKFSSTTIGNALTLNCSTATKLSKWLKSIDAKQIKHMGSYNCRRIGGSRLLSEHSFGTAIDVSSINGVSIKNNWDSIYLKDSFSKACSLFANVLGPDDNKAHKDHFHLDNGFGFGCFFKTFVR